LLWSKGHILLKEWLIVELYRVYYHTTYNEAVEECQFMADITFEDVLATARQLKPEEKAQLIAELQVELHQSGQTPRERILAALGDLVQAPPVSDELGLDEAQLASEIEQGFKGVMSLSEIILQERDEQL
jgi:hypothetical protein